MLFGGGRRRWQWDGMCGKLWKGFPLRGEGWHNWTKHIVSLKMDTHTLHIHHLSPSQFPKAEGCNSLVSSFFQPQFYSPFSLSPSPSPSRPFSFSLISCEMRPFSGMCGLIIADNHSLFPLPLFLFLSGCTVDSGTKSVDALQWPETTCQWGLALQQGCVCVCVCVVWHAYMKI